LRGEWAVEYVVIWGALAVMGVMFVGWWLLLAAIVAILSFFGPGFTMLWLASVSKAKRTGLRLWWYRLMCGVIVADFWTVLVWPIVGSTAPHWLQDITGALLWQWHEPGAIPHSTLKDVAHLPGTPTREAHFVIVGGEILAAVFAIEFLLTGAAWLVGRVRRRARAISEPGGDHADEEDGDWATAGA